MSKKQPSDASGFKSLKTKSVSFFQNLIKTSQDLFWQCNIDQRIIYINPHWTKVFGYKKSEMKGKKFSEFQPEKSALSNHINIDEALGEDSLKGFETIVLSKAGKPIHLYFNPQLINDDEGAITGTIGTAYDITEIKNADRLLKENEQRLRNILEHSSNVFYSHTTDHVLTYFSPQIENLLGYKPAEAMIKWTELATDNPINEIGFQFTEEAIKTGQSLPPYELELQHKNGSKVLVEIREAPVVENGKTVSIVGALVDVTRRREIENALQKSEEKYRLLHESMIDAYVQTNMEGQIIECNRSYLEMLKYSEDELKALTYTDLTPTRWQEMERNIVSNEILPKGFSEVYEKEYIKKDGTVFPVELRTFLLKHEDNEPSGMWAIVRDISERNKAREALEASEIRFKSLFDNSPVSLWEEDFSNVKSYLDKLKQSGVEDFQKHFDEKPQDVLKCISLVKVIDINNETLKLYGAKTKEELLDDLSATFLEESIPVFKEGLIAITEGRTYFQGEAVTKTLTGSLVNVRISWIIPLGYEESLSRILVSILDFTQRKKTEEALKSSENKYRSLFENANDAIFLMKEKIFVDCNPTTAQMFGYSKNELLGISPFQVSPKYQPDGRTSAEMAGEKISEAMNGKPQFFEWVHIKKDGSEFQAEVSLNKIEIDNQTMLLAFVRDITERKLAEKVIEEKEKHYRALFDLSPAGILIEDADGNILDLNESFCSHSGYSRKELIGKNVAILGPNERHEDIKHNISQILDGKILEHDVINKKKDGTLGYLQLRECSITLPDGTLGLISVANDITDRKNAEQALLKSEKRYRMFFEEDISGNYISTPDGRILDCNSAFVQMFGFDSKEDALSFEPKNLYPDPKKREKFLSELKEKRSIDLWGYELKKKDGSPIFIAERTVGIFEDDGQLRKIQGYIFDITDLIKTQAELIKAKEAAEGANRLKDAFIANMSHEIRTPLNGILGMTSLIKERVEQYLAKNDLNYFSAIDIASNRIIRTIDMILNFSRLQVGDFPTNYSLINVTRILAQLVDEYKFTAERKSLTISFENNLGQVTINADEYSLTQAVSNLIDNAIKYTRSGYIKIILTQNSSGKFVILVKDSGVGISEEYLENLFQPYSQEESGYSRAYDGVGLGLSLVKKFLDLNEAKISVTSEKGKGTTFTITIDSNVNRDAKMESEQEVVPPGEYKKELDATANHTVLIVEDDSVNQGFIKAILNRRGSINSLCAFTAQEALEIIEAEKVDLILMDISLGGDMDGLELTKSLRKSESYSNIPIIAVTAHAFPADRQIIIDAGCDDYLAKPFSSKELVEKVNVMLK